MNKENCALKLVDEIILYYDARSKKNIKLNKFKVVRIPNYTLHHANICGSGGTAPHILNVRAA